MLSTSPRQEAAMFFGLWMRGGDLTKLRADITVTPEVFARLSDGMEWAQQLEFTRIREYRKRVLALFDRMVTESYAANETPQ